MEQLATQTETVTMQIDGKNVTCARGTTVLDAALAAGIDVPRLCHNKALEPYGGCRMCMVEIETKKGRKRLVTSCVYEAEDGLKVVTENDEITRIRRMAIELSWPTSSQYAKRYGVTESRFTPAQMDCHLCGLCVRYCAQIKKANNVYFYGRGVNRKLALVEDSATSCSSCGQCFSLCSGGWIVNQM